MVIPRAASTVAVAVPAGNSEPSANREPATPLTAARQYLVNGWQPVPIPPRSKAPTLKSWQQLRVTEDNLARYFSGNVNIGLLLGEVSNRLIDIDLDAPEAVALAAHFLPATDLVHGRPGKPESHWWYVASHAIKTEKFQDVDGTMLLELRSTGAQTVVPPSQHPSGEAITWARFGAPATLEPGAIRGRCARLAACSLVARHWPEEGSRHDAAMALSGFLIRAGLTAEQTARFVEGAARAAGDEEAQSRAGDARDTARAIAAGKQTTGCPTLAALVGEAVAKRLQEWLGVPGTPRDNTNRELEYQAIPEGLVWLKSTNNGPVRQLLTNFTARIVADIVEDDGVEQRHEFEIDAELKGRRARFSVLAGQFPAMTWATEHLGAGAIVHAGLGTRDHARVAIQSLSHEIATRRVLVHTGWVQQNGAWIYLHAGGGIGADGPAPDIEVRLPEGLRRFMLPAPLEGGGERIAAIRASLRMLDVAPAEITIPLYAAIFRAVLGDTDFGLHLAGPTGAGKSELAALAQQHFGAELDARHLPGSWSSTANALEGLAFAAKDALLAVDDFAPAGSQADVQRLHREADRIFRAQGNRAGRQRMRADASLRAAKPPRGLILSTGEDIPAGQSLRARLLILQLSPGMLDWAHLGNCQADARSGLYALALAHFLRWSASRRDELQARLASDVVSLRQKAFESGQHRRTPGIVANLAVGFRCFLEFAVEAEAVTPGEKAAYERAAWMALGEAADAQGQHQQAGDPVQRYLECLRAAIASGRAHVANESGGEPENPSAWGWRRVATGRMSAEWRPQGQRVGWLDGEDLYLEPDAAYAAAQGVARDGGEPIPVGPKTLHKRLHERGVLAGTEQDRGTLMVRRSLEGTRRPVLKLHQTALMCEEPAQSAQPQGFPV